MHFDRYYAFILLQISLLFKSNIFAIIEHFSQSNGLELLARTLSQLVLVCDNIYKAPKEIPLKLNASGKEIN